MLSKGCNPYAYFLNFLVLWSICWSSLVLFKNGSKYLTKGNSPVVYSFDEILPYSLVSSSFLILLRYRFIFSYISTCLMVSTSTIPKFSFLLVFWFFLDLVDLFLPSFAVFRVSLLACQISSLYPHCISSLPISGFPRLFHFWQIVWFRSCTLGGWFFLVTYEVCIYLCIC